MLENPNNFVFENSYVAIGFGYVHGESWDHILKKKIPGFSFVGLGHVMFSFKKIEKNDHRSKHNRSKIPLNTNRY